MDKRPIGIFDSGVGGLTVVKEVLKEMPGEEIVYFGDTARVPYGSKSKDIVTKFSKQDVNFLLSKNVKAIIIACNTVSSNSMEELEKIYDVPIFGVVKPGASQLVKATKNKKVGVIGTSATIRSKAYETEIRRIDSEISVYAKSCPLFVSIVEEGFIDNEIAFLTAQEYLKDFVNTGIDSLVLGCTHYPLLKTCLENVLENKVELVDPAYATAVEVKGFLDRNGLFNTEGGVINHKFYISDFTDKFGYICDKALNKTFNAEIINIEEY